MASRAAHPAQAPGNPVRPRPGRLRHPPHLRARRMTARRCRSRSCIASDFDARRHARRCCSTATAPMAWRCRRRSRPTALSLVDRGFVYAIAHIRGGTDKGWRWYLDGKREKKTNTLRRFHRRGASADRARTTPRPRRIVGHGGSAGGMLMGAVANLRRRTVRRHRRRSAVRRRAQHHARRHAAADAAGMAGMGQPDRPTRGDFRTIARLLALRQCRGAGLSGDPGAWPA